MQAVNRRSRKIQKVGRDFTIAKIIQEDEQGGYIVVLPGKESALRRVPSIAKTKLLPDQIVNFGFIENDKQKPFILNGFPTQGDFIPTPWPFPWPIPTPPDPFPPEPPRPLPLPPSPTLSACDITIIIRSMQWSDSFNVSSYRLDTYFHYQEPWVPGWGGWNINWIRIADRGDLNLVYDVYLLVFFSNQYSGGLSLFQNYCNQMQSYFDTIMSGAEEKIENENSTEWLKDEENFLIQKLFKDRWIEYL